MTLTVLRTTGQVFWRMFFHWDLSEFLLMTRLVLWFGGGRPQRQSTILATSCPRHPLSTWLITVDVELDHPAEGVCVHCEVIAHIPFHTVLFGRRVPHSAHTWGLGRCTPPLWGWRTFENYLEFFCMGDLSPFSCLFNHLFKSVWTHWYLFYTLVSNPMVF